MSVKSTAALFWSRTLTETVVSGGTGTNIGDLTSDGGLAAGFDGTTSQARDSGATSGAANVTNGYIGKTYSPAKIASKIIVYGSNNVGYSNGGNPNVTIKLRGKTGSAPANRTDGTELGTLTFADTANESGNPRTVTSSDTSTSYDHIWADISHDGAADKMSVAELTVYEMA